MLYNLILTSVRISHASVTILFLPHVLTPTCHILYGTAFPVQDRGMGSPRIWECRQLAGPPQPLRFPPNTQILLPEEPLQPEKSPHPHTGQYRSARTGPSLHLGQFGGGAQVQNPSGTRWALCWSELCWTSSFSPLCVHLSRGWLFPEQESRASHLLFYGRFCEGGC